MQTIFFMALFSFVFSLLAGIVSNGVSNSHQLGLLRVDETRDYFNKISKVVLNDITVDNLTANPGNATTVPDYINLMVQLKMLSDGRYGNAAVDSWGNPITGKIITEYQSLTSTADPNNKVVVPVTGFLLVSNGPDGVLQTTIPTITTLAQIYTVVVPTDASGKPLNDDIIYAFDNRTVQANIFESMKGSLNRIGIAARKQLEAATSTYRQNQALIYNQQIASGKEGDLTLLDTANDPNAPRFPCLTVSLEKNVMCPSGVSGADNRHALGVETEFETLERTLPGRGNFVVTAPQPATANDPLILSIQNSTSKPTPWGNPSSSFKFQVSIKNTSS